MALTIKERQNKGGGGSKVKPGKRLYLTKDGQHLVPFGHLLAATLYCTENHYVQKDEYEALVANGTPEEPEIEPDSTPKTPGTGAPSKELTDAHNVGRDFSKLTVADLDELIAANSIEVDPKANKAEKIAAVETYIAQATGGGSSEEE